MGPLLWGPWDPQAQEASHRRAQPPAQALCCALLFFVSMAQGPHLKDPDLQDSLILWIPQILACGVPYSS